MSFGKYIKYTKYIVKLATHTCTSYVVCSSLVQLAEAKWAELCKPASAQRPAKP